MLGGSGVTIRPADMSESRAVEASFAGTPQPDALGYQAALEAGMDFFELGASSTALPYFERAAALRRTGIALTYVARCLRDLARPDEAERTYREAMAATGGGSGHALVGLIAVLCDLRRYEDALPLAQRAAVEFPDSAPAQTVAARCLDEFVGVMESSGTASTSHLDFARCQADALRRRAQELEPETAAVRLRRRRNRAFALHALYPQTLAVSGAKPAGPIDETHEPADPPAQEGDASSPCDDQGKTVRIGLLRRLLRVLMGGGSGS